MCFRMLARQSLTTWSTRPATAANVLPNTIGWGHFETGWRQWPCEERLDQTHPKTIGATPLPPVKGYEELPPQRVKLKDLLQSNPPPNEPPSGPTVPGDQNLPGLPPGDFKPGPTLPPDLNNPGISTAGHTTRRHAERDSTVGEKEPPPAESPKDKKSDATPAVGGLKFKSAPPANRRLEPNVAEPQWRS